MTCRRRRMGEVRVESTSFLPHIMLTKTPVLNQLLKMCCMPMQHDAASYITFINNYSFQNLKQEEDYKVRRLLLIPSFPPAASPPVFPRPPLPPVSLLNVEWRPCNEAGRFEALAATSCSLYDVLPAGVRLSPPSPLPLSRCLWCCGGDCREYRYRCRDMLHRQFVAPTY